MEIKIAGNYLCEIGYKWETTFKTVQSLFGTRRDVDDKLRK
jgi:hypothetical protein